MKINSKKIQNNYPFKFIKNYKLKKQLFKTI